MKFSLRTKITLLFFVVFLFICTLCGVCITLVLNSNYRTQNDYQKSVVDALIEERNFHSDINATEFLLNRGFSVISDKKLIERVQNNAKSFFELQTRLGTISSLCYHYNFYLRIQSQEDTLFTAKRNYIAFEFLSFGFMLSLILAFILYLYIIRYLNSLEKLRKQITDSASNGNFSISEYEKDEIGEIATEFSSTIHKMRELVESRQLFLRTIMHEFKTPIGKGRLVAEMVKEKRQKERLVSIFTRLDALINESAKIESLFSKNYALKISPHRFDEVLEVAKELLLDFEIDKKVKVKKSSKLTLNVDIDSFALVLKNLIENALKYSDDGLCVIECFKNGFSVRNKGKPFKHDYAEYLKPFTREKDNKKEGMGLGLYIVDKTCQSHNFELHYEFKGSNHCFKIITEPNLTQNAENLSVNSGENSKNETLASENSSENSGKNSRLGANSRGKNSGSNANLRGKNSANKNSKGKHLKNENFNAENEVPPPPQFFMRKSDE